MLSSIIDYGCGVGEIVIAGRAHGLNIFYAGGGVKREIQKAGLLGTIIQEIADGQLDFPDAYFDGVISSSPYAPGAKKV